MGVSGSGKTTIGQRLAQDLGWPSYNGEDFHPPANVDKISRGMALTDANRDPWLAALRQLIAKANILMSQFEASEQPGEALTVAVSPVPEIVVGHIKHNLGL
jgi:gluconate kinase